MKLSQKVVLLVAMLTTHSCRKKKSDDPAPPPSIDLVEEEPLDKDWWMHKAQATLRLSEPWKESSNIDDLLQKDIHDIALKMMGDEAFYNMLTDFSMYWMGVKSSNFFTSVDSNSTEIGISNDVVQYLPALNAANFLLKGSDYFQGLFSEAGSNYVTQVAPPYLNDSTNILDIEGRKNLRAEIVKILSDFITEVTPLAADSTKKEFCAKLVEFKSKNNFSLGAVNFSGSFFDNGDGTQSKTDFNVIESWCMNDASTLPNISDLIAYILQHAQSDQKLLDSLDQKLGLSNPLQVKHVTKLTKVDWETTQHTKEFKLWNETIFFKVQNSSTNRNRKRASWILKRFMCDDLTPIGVEIPATHTADAHGSDPACYACHYKLDPMAGYFRELGFFGVSFANSSTIFFDDGAQAERSIYEKPWRTVENNSREWNIGFIRSTTDSSKNTYGSNFSDLLMFLQKAPEVKDCFVKRVFEYTVGEEQAFDRSWGKKIVEQMEETSKKDKVLAIKEVFASVVTSKAYLAKNRDPNKCYDLPVGVNSQERAPCRIASIIERNCQSCHSDTNSQGGLNLTSWKKQADGEFGFNLEKNGTHKPTKEVFQTILDRLSSDDSSIRMPLMKTMPDSERQELYLWLSNLLNKKESN